MKRVVLILASVLFLFAGCNNKQVAKENIRMVKTETVVRYGENETVSYPGKVKASAEVNIAFRISGPIAAIRAKEGELVHKGQVLAQMDSRDYEIQLQATEAEYKQVKAEAERIMELYEKNSIAENDYDKAVAGLRRITAKYESHKNALADTKLVAPFEGYVQKKYFDKDETISAGMPVFSLISTRSPEVVINIPAGDFIRREQFDACSCSFDVYPDRLFPLELIGVNHKANLNQLYTVRFKLSESAGNEVLPSPGMSTMVTIAFKPKTAGMVAIPVSAMFEIDGCTSVWLYDAATQKVTARQIRLFEILADGTVVVAEGLQPGDVVVVAGVHSLTDGQQVKLLESPSKTNVGGLL